MYIVTCHLLEEKIKDFINKKMNYMEWLKTKRIGKVDNISLKASYQPI